MLAITWSNPTYRTYPSVQCATFDFLQQLAGNVGSLHANKGQFIFARKQLYRIVETGFSRVNVERQDASSLHAIMLDIGDA